jgi:hypothetical protein
VEELEDGIEIDSEDDVEDSSVCTCDVSIIDDDSDALAELESSLVVDGIISLDTPVEDTCVSLEDDITLVDDKSRTDEDIALDDTTFAADEETALLLTAALAVLELTSAKHSDPTS